MLARIGGTGAARGLRRMRSVIAPWVKRQWLFRWVQGLSWQIPMSTNGGICSFEINFTNGFFAQLAWCLLIFKYCELHQLIPDICLSGQYRDPNRGRNWRDYHFDISRPMTSEGVPRRVRYTKKLGEYGELGQPMLHRMSLEDSTRLFFKYLKPKSHIMTLVDNFWNISRFMAPLSGFTFVEPTRR